MVIHLYSTAVGGDWHQADNGKIYVDDEAQ
jgi:hypothetical protein